MANAIRALAMDAVQQADSGHPGMPMGMADVATVLFTKFLKFDPSQPNWPDRDRFILSAGHGSMLLYSLLHLTGYDLSLDDLKNFRQWGSKTPGHPERGVTPGIEVTTGPLGQDCHSGNPQGQGGKRRNYERHCLRGRGCDGPLQSHRDATREHLDSADQGSRTPPAAK